MSHHVDIRAAMDAHAAAVHAYRNLDAYALHIQVHRVAEIVGKPVNRLTGALLCESLRMGMIFACEARNHDLVEHYYDKIMVLAPRRPAGSSGGPSPIPYAKAARHWAQGWKFEVRGEHEAALDLRHYQCRRLGGRAKELHGKRPWTPGERTEAILLVDLFADMVRSLRRCRPPIGSFGAIPDQLGEDLHDSEFIRLSEDSRVTFLSRRRARMRLACEIADRQPPASPKEAKARLHLRQELLTDPLLIDTSVPMGTGGSSQACLSLDVGSPIARLDDELFEMEKWLAYFGAYTDIEAICDRHLERFEKIGFTRRAESLTAHRNLIRAHGRAEIGP